MLGDAGIDLDGEKRVGIYALFNGLDAGSEGVGGKQKLFLRFIGGSQEKTAASLQLNMAAEFALRQGLLEQGLGFGWMPFGEGDGAQVIQAQQTLLGADDVGGKLLQQFFGKLQVVLRNTDAYPGKHQR